MAIEDLDFKDPGDLSKEMGEAVLSDLFGQEGQEEVKGQGDPQPDQVIQEDVSVEESSEEYNEDIPNASIRLEKMRNQRDEERNKRSELEMKLAEIQGKLSVLEKRDNPEDVVDPTEYMDDSQKLLFNENKELKSTVAKLTEVVQNIQSNESVKKLQDQENQFFESNPELQEKKAEIVDGMLDYLQDKQGIKDMLKNGRISIGEVYGMYSAANPTSKKKVQVNNPEKVFSGHSKSVPKVKTNEAEIETARKKAINILNDRNSRNKRQAVDFLQEEITKDIFSQLEI